MSDPIDWAGNLPYYVAAMLFGYVLGSIPFGLIITRFAGLGDVRNIGSGNIGATNVLRTGRKGLAALTLLADALKGTAAVLIAGIYGAEYGLVAGFGAFIGHILPVWLGFKGGKGVATYIGVLLAVSWQAGLVFALVWLGMAAWTRFSSVAALTASLVTPLALWFFGLGWAALLFLLMTLIVYLKHHANIRRLLDGTETRIGAKG